MRRFLYITLFSLALIVGCGKNGLDTPEKGENMMTEEKEIVFIVSDSSATKAPTPVTSLSSFYVSATTGTNTSNQQSEFTNAVFIADEGGTFTGSKVWPTSDPGYHFYASNIELSYVATGATVTISSINTDVVCATKYNSSFKTTNTLTFDHILARIGTVTFVNLGACSNVKLEMKYKAKGTYNLRSKTWSNTGSTYSTKQLTTSDNNLWIIPGTYQITLSYTDAGGTAQTKTLNQAFEAGEINNITAKLGDGVIVKTETEYEAPTYTLGTISDIPASGGPSGTPSVTDVSQRKRDKYTYANGSVSYGDYTSVSGLSYTVLYGKTTSSLSSTCPSYTGSNLGTTEVARTKMGDIYVRVTSNSVYTDQSTEVYQEANGRILGDMDITYSYNAIAPTAGTATPTLSYSLPYSWTSGANGSYTSGASVSYATVEDNSAATLAADGKVAWTQNTGTTRTEKERVTVTLNGVSATKDAVSTQNGDGVSSYENPTITLSYPDSPVAYNSTTAISPTLVVTQKINYVSGRSETVTLESSQYTVTYSASAVTGLTLNSNTGAVTPSDNTGAAIAARTEYGDLTVSSFIYGNIVYTGGLSTPSISYSQEKTTYTAGRNSTTSRSINVTASVTANQKTASSAACVVTQNGDAGVAVTSTTRTLRSGASITYSGSNAGFTITNSGTVTADNNTGTGGGVTYSNPLVTFTSATTSIAYSGGSVTCNEATYTQTQTTAARNSTSARSVTVTASLTLHGKTTTRNAVCTQNGDPGAASSTDNITTGGNITYSSSGAGFSNNGRTITAASNAGESYTEYADPSISVFSYPNVKASGGSAVPTVTFTQTETTGRRATSSRTGSITASVTLNGKTGTNTITFTQAGDEGTSTSSSADITGATKSYTTVTDNNAATLNATTGVVTWEAYTNTTANRTETERVTVTCNGKSATKDGISTQLKKSAWDVDDDDDDDGGNEGGGF